RVPAVPLFIQPGELAAMPDGMLDVAAGDAFAREDRSEAEITARLALVVESLLGSVVAVAGEVVALEHDGHAHRELASVRRPLVGDGLTGRGLPDQREQPGRRVRSRR